MNKQDDFIQVFVDCKGYSVDEARELAMEYSNDIVACLKDMGADETAIKELTAYLN